MPAVDFKRRHFARNSNTLKAGVSSMYSGASERRPMRSCNWVYSCGFRLPLRNLSELISVSAEIKRCTNWTADISSEKTATGTLYSTVMFRAMVRTNAVLPIPGRAARTIMSDFWKPPVMRSRSTNPVDTPLTPPSWLRALSMVSSAWRMMLLIDS